MFLVETQAYLFGGHDGEMPLPGCEKMCPSLLPFILLAIESQHEANFAYI